MMDALRPVMTLNLTFQKKDVDLAAIKPAVDRYLKDLSDIRNGVNPLNKPCYYDMPEEILKDATYKGHTLLKPTRPEITDSVKECFLNAVIENTEKRFPDTDMMTAFGVLGLRPVLLLQGEALENWGVPEIQRLVDHFGKQQKHTFVKNKIPQTHLHLHG